MKSTAGFTQHQYHFAAGDPSPDFVDRITANTYAIILAGGHDVRLHQLTQVCAKAAVPFGGKFRIIDFVLSNCINSGIRHIGIATQNRSNHLIQHIRRGWSFLNGHLNEFIDLLPAQQRISEEHWYKGTADAAYQNFDIIRQYHPDFILILSGDHVYKMNYGKLLAFHAENKADLTIACTDLPLSDASSYGVISLNENSRVIEFSEKPAHPASIPDKPGYALVNMGIYVFNTEFLLEQLLLDAVNLHSRHDFGQNLIPSMIKSHFVFAQNFVGSCTGNSDLPYWRDIDSIDSYWEANMGLTNVTPDLNLYDKKWPIWTRHEHTPPAKFVFDDNGMRGMAVDSLVSGGCIISGSLVRRSLLFYDVHIECFCSIDDSVLLPNVCIGRHVILKKVIVDKDCRIPDGLVIGGNPDEDRKFFYVSPKGVTLITSDALTKMALKTI